MLLTLTAPVLGRWAAPSDPFQLEAAFPWLALAPLLVSLQHGLLPGLMSSALLTALAYGYTHSFASAEQGSLAGFAAGCFALAALAGQFRDSAKHRALELSAASRELEEQLERLSRTHSALKLSHARLEERLAAERWSLDACLSHAERSLVGATSLSARAQVVLDVLATHALVQGAAVYLVASGSLQRFPIATLGQPAGLVFSHPLVLRALESRRLVALSGREPSSGDSRVLAAIPLVTAAGNVRAVVAIHQMPFMAFHAEQLEKLATICARLADLLDFSICAPSSRGAMQAPAPAATRAAREDGRAELDRPSRPSQPVSVS